jgi:hypothetical protein
MQQEKLLVLTGKIQVYCSQMLAFGLQKKGGDKKRVLQTRSGKDNASKGLRLRAERPEYRGSTPDGARGFSLHRVRTGPAGHPHIFLSTG